MTVRGGKGVVDIDILLYSVLIVTIVMMKTLMAYIDADCQKLHQLLQRELNFTENGIPLPKSQRGYNFSKEVRQMIQRLAIEHDIRIEC